MQKKLRAKQVAQKYSVGLSTVWLYAKQKKITKTKISAKVTVFDIEELDKFFDGENNKNTKTTN